MSITDSGVGCGRKGAPDFRCLLTTKAQGSGMGLTISRSNHPITRRSAVGRRKRQARSYVLFHSAERTYDLKINCMTWINKGGRSLALQASPFSTTRAKRQAYFPAAPDVTYVLGQHT